MKAHPAINVITGIFAVIFCIILVLSSLSTVVITSLSSCITPDGITKLITNVDYSEMILESVDEQMSEDDAALTGEVINEIIQSDAAKEIISSAAESITAGLTGDTSYEGLSAEDIKKIGEENLDELVQIVKDVSDEEIDTSELRAEITEFIDESAEEIAEMLPDAEEIRAELSSEIDGGMFEAVKFFLSGKLTVILIIVTLAVTAVICLLRIWNFSGFIFAGVASVFSCLLTVLLTVSVLVMRANAMDIFGKEPYPYITSLIDAVYLRLNVSAVILAVFAAILITTFALLRKFVYKKKIESTL